LGRLGTAAIFGNHDYGHGWRQREVAEVLAAQLTLAGVTVLRNEQVDFAGLNIIGIDDYWSPNFNPGRAMGQLNPLAANLTLVHNPDVVDLDVWEGYEGWILAGHTHGGQVKPPFLPPPVLPVENKRYTAGEFALGDGRFLYINRALGGTISLRFNVRPEVGVFTLVPA
jgi:predicted MPP superfamily phosphohydrolase